MPEEEQLQSNFLNHMIMAQYFFFFFLHTHGIPFVYTGKEGKHSYVKRRRLHLPSTGLEWQGPKMQVTSIKKSVNPMEQ